MNGNEAKPPTRLDSYAVLLLCVLGSVSGGGIGATWFGRPDPFTGAMGKQLKQDLRTEIAAVVAADKLAMEQLEFRIRRDMPPLATKKRIRALEEVADRCEQGQGRRYRPPTYDWN